VIREDRVRQEVVKQGHNYEKMINDKNWVVRAEIARNGYSLDKLVNDESIEVSKLINKCYYMLTF